MLLAACKGGGCPSHVSRDLFSDQASLYISGLVNSQNILIWSAENPHAGHKTPLHTVRIGVRFAVFSRRTVGPIFFGNKINSKRYIDAVHEFLGQLIDEEIAEHGTDKTAQHVTQHGRL
jgi:hypothetical protein